MACITIYMLGTGNAIHPYRANSSILLRTSEDLLLVDAGCGAINNIARHGIDPAVIDVVLVTHGHPDHYAGLLHLAFLKTFSNHRSLKIYTTKHASRLIERLLSSLHKPEKLDIEVNIVEPGETYRINNLIATVLEARHSVEAVSLEIKYSNVRILVSGDTSPTQIYKSRARGADVAIHEATLPSGMEDIGREIGHTTVRQAIDQVREARHKILYHISPESEREAATLGEVLVPSDNYTLEVCKH